MERTAKLDLPYIMPSQAQKHVTHNEALSALDAIVHLSVIDSGVTSPPSSPNASDRYLVGIGATGLWTGQDGKIAAYVDGEWLFWESRTGWVCFVEANSTLMVKSGAGWATLEGAANPATFGVNALPTLPERLSVASPSSLFSHEGADHRLKINKNATADTASLVLQKGFSGRAEIGLCGSDGLRVKVSPDGLVWHDSIRVDATNGKVELPANPNGIGLVKQVKVATKGTIFSTDLATFQAAGLAVTLTPGTLGSRVFVRASLHLGARFWNTAPLVAIFRNSTQVWPAAGGGGLSNQFLAATDAHSRWHTYTGSLEFQDLPGTIAPVSYSVHLASKVAGQFVHLNARDLDLLVLGESSISATELAL